MKFEIGYDTVNKTEYQMTISSDFTVWFGTNFQMIVQQLALDYFFSKGTYMIFCNLNFD